MQWCQGPKPVRRVLPAFFFSPVPCPAQGEGTTGLNPAAPQDVQDLDRGFQGPKLVREGQGEAAL